MARRTEKRSRAARPECPENKNRGKIMSERILLSQSISWTASFCIKCNKYYYERKLNCCGQQTQRLYSIETFTSKPESFSYENGDGKAGDLMLRPVVYGPPPREPRVPLDATKIREIDGSLRDDLVKELNRLRRIRREQKHGCALWQKCNGGETCPSNSQNTCPDARKKSSDQVKTMIDGMFNQRHSGKNNINF